MATIKCDIVSAEAEIFHGQATMVIASGEMGELGIAPRHAPLITRLKPGQVRVIPESGEEQFFYVSGGILEVQPSVVTILADTAIRDRRPPQRANVVVEVLDGLVRIAHELDHVHQRQRRGERRLAAIDP